MPLFREESGDPRRFPVIWRINGGAEEDRTPDLRIANATLSQLSYGPTRSRECTSGGREKSTPSDCSDKSRPDKGPRGKVTSNRVISRIVYSSGATMSRMPSSSAVTVI